MKEVSTSSLNELKSVFNSADDNVHYYKILKRAFNGNEFGVELAEPAIRHTSGQIKWKTGSDSNFITVDSLDRAVRDRVGDRIRNAFKAFEVKAKGIKNFPPDFDKQIMEIPNSSSVLVSNGDGEGHIVITNWGFLEDALDRKSGILQTLFPAPTHSILVRVVSPSDTPIAGKRIELRSEEISFSDITDTNGYSSMGSLTRGAVFSLYDDMGNPIASGLIADDRPEYVVQLAREINMVFRIRTSLHEPVSDFSVAFSSPEYGSRDFVTDQDGAFSLTHPDSGSEYRILDADGSEIHRDTIPKQDATVEIVVDTPKPEVPIVEEPAEEPEEEFEEEPVLLPEDNVEVKFTNYWGRPIKGQSFIISDVLTEEKIQTTTDEHGKAAIASLSAGDKKVEFDRRNALWKHSFVHAADNSCHHFYPKCIYPWFWWILCAVLLTLLLYCLFATACWCELGTSYPEHEERYRIDTVYLDTVDHDTDLDRRRESLGGGVGDITITLTWNTRDDLDLHLLEPTGDHIYFRNKTSRSGGQLDIDMNAGGRASSSPMENISYPGRPPTGRYKILIHYYAQKAPSHHQVPYQVYVKVGEKELTLEKFHEFEDAKHFVYEFDYNP